MTGAMRRRAVDRPSIAVALVRLAAFAVLVLGLAACFPLEPAPHPSAIRTDAAVPGSVAPLAPLVVPAVLNYCPLLDAVHYSGYPLPVDEVYICRGDGRHSTDGISSYGPWETAWHIEHPEKLLLAYRTADATKSRTVCRYSFPSDPLIVWVHRNGVTTAYYAPVDGCGSPSRAAATAYAHAQRTLLIAVDRGAPDPAKATSIPGPAFSTSAKDQSG